MVRVLSLTVEPAYASLSVECAYAPLLVGCGNPPFHPYRSVAVTSVTRRSTPIGRLERAVTRRSTPIGRLERAVTRRSTLVGARPPEDTCLIERERKYGEWIRVGVDPSGSGSS